MSMVYRLLHDAPCKNKAALVCVCVCNFTHIEAYQKMQNKSFVFLLSKLALAEMFQNNCLHVRQKGDPGKRDSLPPVNGQPRVLVFQCDNRPNVDFVQKTRNVNETLADRFGWKYQFNNMSVMEGHHPAVCKIFETNTLLRANKSTYDFIVFLDSDAWIYNPVTLDSMIRTCLTISMVCFHAILTYVKILL